jgi:hypothetical protein
VLVKQEMIEQNILCQFASDITIVSQSLNFPIFFNSSALVFDIKIKEKLIKINFFNYGHGFG